MKKWVLVIVAALAVAGAGANDYKFPYPEIPMMLTGTTDRADYLAVHYWDRFDFKDNTLIGNGDVTEQGFVNFLSILPHSTKKAEAVSALFDHAATNRKMLDYFVETSERYLYDLDSPMYDEDLYYFFLQKWTSMSAFSNEEKWRYTSLMKDVTLNRVGERTANLTFQYKDGRRGAIHNVTTRKYILLYFNDPTCEGCMEMKAKLTASPAITRAVENGSLTVLAVSVDGKEVEWKEQRLPAKWVDVYDFREQADRLYNLRSLPMLYLLDSSHRILKKNITQKEIEEKVKNL